MSALPPKFAGIPVDLGGEIGPVIVPGLSLGQMEDPVIQAGIAGISKAGTAAERMNAALAFVLPALQRNYPITETVLRVHVDTNNLLPLIQAVLGSSGMKPTRELPSGNVGAATPK